MDEITTIEPVGTSRVSLEQRQVMLTFMISNPALGTGRFVSPDGAKLKARLQVELAEKLNSIGSGGTKAPEKWYKCWQDWKSDVKRKASKIKRHANGTGGGPPLKVQLTELEEQLVAFMGPVAVTGHPVVDPLDAQCMVATGATTVADDLPVGQWIQLQSAENGEHSPMEPSRVSEEHLNLTPTSSISSPPSSAAPSVRSSSSDRSRPCPKRSFRSVSESSTAPSSEIVRAALQNADAVQRQAEVAAKRLALEKEEHDQRQSMRAEELELRRREVDNNERLVTAMSAMAAAVTATMNAVQIYLAK